MIDSPQMVELTNYQLTTNPPSPILRRLDPANLTKDPFVIALVSVVSGVVSLVRWCSVYDTHSQTPFVATCTVQ